MKLPPLPDTQYGLAFYDDGGMHNISGSAYTEDHMQAYGLACARAALEEAAKVCEKDAESYRYDPCRQDECLKGTASSIRAIKIEGETP